MKFQRKIYTDFSQGLNDTLPMELLAENALLVADNIDLAKNGAIQSRKGVKKINSDSFTANATQLYEWQITDQTKLLAIIDRYLYEIKEDGRQIKKMQVAKDTVSFFTIQHKLYIADGNDIYVWGDSNYYQEEKKATVAEFEIVKAHDRFYQAVKDLGEVELEDEKYEDTNRWKDVTEIEGIISSVIKPAKPYMAEYKHEFELSIYRGATQDGVAVITLNGHDFSVSVRQGDTPDTIAESLRKLSPAEYNVSGSGSKVRFKAADTGSKKEPVYSCFNTGASGSITTIQYGGMNDNIFGKIRKCTMFAQHPVSLAIFASGNPKDPTALYFSDYNNVTYFPETNVVYPTNSEGKVTALFAFGRSILVSYLHSWWEFTGIDPTQDAMWQRVPVPYGALNNESIAMTPYSFTFLGRDGIYCISASITTQASTIETGDSMIRNLAQNKVENAIKNIQDKEKARMVFYDNKILLAYNDNERVDYNTKVLAFDWKTGAFTRYTGWVVNDWCYRNNETLIFASNNYILETENGYCDIDTQTGENTAIHMNVMTKHFDLGSKVELKYVKRVYLIFRQESQVQTTVDITIAADEKYIKSKDIDLIHNLSWGRNWGLVFGRKDTMHKCIDLREIAGRYQVQIENMHKDQNAALYGIAFDFGYTKPKANGFGTISTKKLLE